MKRRDFIKTAATSGLAFSVIPSHVLGGQGRVSPNDKLNVALIGCGTQGLGSLRGWLRDPDMHFISVCDPNKDSYDYPLWGPSRGENKGFNGGREPGRRMVNEYYAENNKRGSYKGCTAYADFRELLEKENDLDAIIIMTPDHLHATIAIAAMRKNISVATHKPISNFMHESRATIEFAKKSGVFTHCLFFQDPPMTYTMKQLVKQGVIGKVKELHRWTNRPVWPQGSPYLPEERPVPSGFDWQLWLGPSTDRPYSPDYTHTTYRGWYEFGGGVLADMGFYGLWRDWRVLNLGMPLSAKADSSFTCEIRDFRSWQVKNNLSFPHASMIHFEVPVLEKDEIVDVYWYDGNMKPKTPRYLLEIGQELNDQGGVMFIGEKGIIYTSYDNYDNLQLLGVKGAEDILASITVPEEYLALSRNEMINALSGKKPSRGNFENVQIIEEAISLGNLAVRTGQRLRWDDENLRVTNLSEANQYIKREFRRGWEL